MNQTPYETRGFRLFDLVSYEGKCWYIHGRRLKGAFAIKRLSDSEKLERVPSKLRFISEQHAYLIEKVKY